MPKNMNKKNNTLYTIIIVFLVFCKKGIICCTSHKVGIVPHITFSFAKNNNNHD